MSTVQKPNIQTFKCINANVHIIVTFWPSGTNMRIGRQANKQTRFIIHNLRNLIKFLETHTE